MGELRSSEIDSRSARAAELWQELERRAPAPYFLSWEFLEVWLDALPDEVRPRLHAVTRGGRTVAVFLLGARPTRRHLLGARARHLNVSGDERYDEITLEHNRVLCEPGMEPTLSEWLEALPEGWDELCLPALAADAFPATALGQPLGGAGVTIERSVESPYVDLGRVRATPGGYLALLGPNTRAAIRRAERGYGQLALEVARSPAQADEYLAELVELHQLHWRKRAEPGAFGDPWFLHLHRELVARRLAHGEVQLLRVRAAHSTVGVLYNFVWRGRVLFYQSGLVESEDPRKKPGYVCHAQAVTHNAALGHSVYDFLGGDARYKLSLSTATTGLIWARVERPLARFAVERRLRELRRAVLG